MPRQGTRKVFCVVAVVRRCFDCVMARSVRGNIYLRLRKRAAIIPHIFGNRHKVVSALPLDAHLGRRAHLDGMRTVAEDDNRLRVALA